MRSFSPLPFAAKVGGVPGKKIDIENCCNGAMYFDQES
jgi:hypothetical protein